MGISVSQRGPCWALDISSVPTESKENAGKFPGLFFITFALVWIGIFMAVLIKELEAGGIQPSLLFVLIVQTIGVGILLIGVRQLLWWRTVAFDGETFTVTERGLRGERQWREPLSAYHGVMRRKKESRYGSYYTVDLVHRDSDRTINVYTEKFTRSVDSSDLRFRQVWEDYARRLKLPALEDPAGGMVRREVADLDKSLGELTREGKVDIDYQTLSRPAEGLTVGFEGDDVLITRTGPESTWWGVLFAVLFPLVIVGAGFLAPKLSFVGRVMVGGTGLLLELVLVKGVVNDLTSRKRLRVGPNGVRVCTVSGRGESKGEHIGAQAIESVTVAAKSETLGFGSWVAIAGDKQMLKFGANLPRPSLDFIMNTVLAKIAETERRWR